MVGTQDISKTDRNTRIAKCSTLAKKISKYGFEGPVHYTDFDNLGSILRSGYLKSRNLQNSEHSHWVDSALQDAIERTVSEVKDYVRFFYYYMTPTVYCFEQTSASRGSEQVVLVFRNDILSDDGTRFTARIAAGHHGELYDNPGEALLFPWSEIFERGELPSKYYNYASYDRKKKLRQAEFLYPEKVGIDRLAAIYFKSEAKLREAVRMYGNNPLFRLDTDRKRFNYNITAREVKRGA